MVYLNFSKVEKPENICPLCGCECGDAIFRYEMDVEEYETGNMIV